MSVLIRPPTLSAYLMIWCPVTFKPHYTSSHYSLSICDVWLLWLALSEDPVRPGEELSSLPYRGWRRLTLSRVYHLTSAMPRCCSSAVPAGLGDASESQPHGGISMETSQKFLAVLKIEKTYRMMPCWTPIPIPLTLFLLLYCQFLPQVSQEFIFCLALSFLAGAHQWAVVSLCLHHRGLFSDAGVGRQLIFKGKLCTKVTDTVTNNHTVQSHEHTLVTLAYTSHSHTHFKVTHTSFTHTSHNHTLHSHTY